MRTNKYIKAELNKRTYSEKNVLNFRDKLTEYVERMYD
jgi:hypothetical protein